MRHRVAKKKLGRSVGHRRALYRSLLTALFRHKRIETTLAKAKAVQPLAEKLITIARRGDLHSRRLIAAYLWDKKVATELFREIAPKYKDRPGGYTRILKLGFRQGDGAEMAVLELVE